MAELRHLAGDANRFAVIDTETTGVYNHDRIIDIAILTMGLDGKITDRWGTLIQPEGRMGATEIHGITPSMVEHAPVLGQVAEGIAERLHGACLVGHNVSFDIRMLSNEFERLGGSVICERYLDTRKIHSGRLEEACRKFGVSLTGAHSALGDAEASAGLFLAGYRSLNITGTASRVSATRVLVRRPQIGRQRSRDTERLGTFQGNTNPNPGPGVVNSAPGVVLKAGDEIVVTGKHPYFTRREICSLLKSKGFTLGNSITSRTKLLLALDLSSESSKARKSRELGIPIIALEDFITRT